MLFCAASGQPLIDSLYNARMRARRLCRCYRTSKTPLTNNTGRATVRGPHQCAAYQPKGGTLFEQLHFLQRAVAKTYGLAPNSVQIQAAVPFEEHAVVVVFRINLWRPVDIQLVEESHPGIAMVRNHTASVIRETDAMSSRRVRQRWQQERKRA